MCIQKGDPKRKGSCGSYELFVSYISSEKFYIICSWSTFQWLTSAGPKSVDKNSAYRRQLNLLSCTDNISVTITLTNPL